MVSPAPKTPTTVKTPTAPTFKTPGMSLSPQFGGVLKTPTVPSIGATNKTPVQQTGAVKDKSTLFSLKGQSLSIVPSDYDPSFPKPGQQHRPAPAFPMGELPTLYHGSSSTIKKGEQIKPGGEKSKEFAFATSSPEIAALYAHNRGSARGDTTQGMGQQTLWNVIHKVTPNSPSNTYIDRTPHGKGTSSYISREGFTSQGPAALVDNQGNVTPLYGGKGFATSRSIAAAKSKRGQAFEQGTLDFGNWQPKVNPIV